MASNGIKDAYIKTMRNHGCHRETVYFPLPFKPLRGTTNIVICDDSEVCYQTGHAHSVIRHFAILMLKVCVLSYTIVAQRRFGQFLMGAETDLDLRLMHIHFVGFIIGCVVYVIIGQTK